MGLCGIACARDIIIKLVVCFTSLGCSSQESQEAVLYMRLDLHIPLLML